MVCSGRSRSKWQSLPTAGRREVTTQAQGWRAEAPCSVRAVRRGLSARSVPPPTMMAPPAWPMPARRACTPAREAAQLTHWECPVRVAMRPSRVLASLRSR